MKRMLPQFGIVLALICCLGFGSQQAAAQVTVTSGSPYSQYAQNLAGLGVTISNVNIACDTLPGTPPPAMGGFNAALTTIGLTSGMLITSGSIENALTTGGIGAANNFPGSPLLTALVGGNTNDACRVTFDFEASCTQVTFKFVFGSNEYPTFV
ncbi:MAG: choice-of-anchor L domain-containing protein, partial [Bacteroidia bacterium]|nr:choice-of-anchor L domain-containing protein [Bacteroidia bacterium]